MHIKVAELKTHSDGNGASHYYTFLKFANLKMVCKYLHAERTNNATNKRAPMEHLVTFIAPIV